MTKFKGTRKFSILVLLCFMLTFDFYRQQASIGNVIKHFAEANSQQLNHNYELLINKSKLISTNKISNNNNNNNTSGGSQQVNNNNINNNNVKRKQTGANHNQELQRHLNERQYELVKQNPGSLVAVARAIKMAIIECQYQMRHEPWDCPTYGFSPRPVDVFGKLMSRSFKETSFIHSLLSAALTHSVARACTESIITSCGGGGRKLTRDGGFSEDVEFGQQFAQEFMDTSSGSGNSLSSFAPQFGSSSNQADSSDTNYERNVGLSNEILASSSSQARSMGDIQGKQLTQAKYKRFNQQQQQHQQQQQLHHQQQLDSNEAQAQGFEVASRKDLTIRNIINAHNDELGRLLVLNNMRRACKCHGLSGACSMQTCWLKLPSFREIANQLHDKFDQAIRLISVTHRPISKPKALTSASSSVMAGPSGALTTRKTNKKRSSSPHHSTHLNGLSRSAASMPYQSHQQASTRYSNYGSPMPYGTYLSPNSDSLPNIIGSRSSRNTKSHMMSDEADDGYRSSDSSLQSSTNNISPNSLSSDLVQPTNRNLTGEPLALQLDSVTDQAPTLARSPSRISTSSVHNNSSNIVRRRPVARSIGFEAQYITPSKLDLLYNQNSPDFCTPSERYDIKGTKGRICGDDGNPNHRCETLCCGRGYIKELREEKYNCECQFKFCCQLDCKTCTRRRGVYKCL